MLSLPRSVRIYVASAPVDMRMGHNGLFAVVREQWKEDPFTGHLFVFFGRAHDPIRSSLRQLRYPFQPALWRSFLAPLSPYASDIAS